MEPIGRKIVMVWGRDNITGKPTKYVELAVCVGDPADVYPEMESYRDEDNVPRLGNGFETAGEVFELVKLPYNTEVFDRHIGRSRINAGHDLSQTLAMGPFMSEWENQGLNSEDELIIDKID